LTVTDKARSGTSPDPPPTRTTAENLRSGSEIRKRRPPPPRLVQPYDLYFSTCPTRRPDRPTPRGVHCEPISTVVIPRASGRDHTCANPSTYAATGLTAGDVITTQNTPPRCKSGPGIAPADRRPNSPVTSPAGGQTERVSAGCSRARCASTRRSAPAHWGYRRSSSPSRTTTLKPPLLRPRCGLALRLRHDGRGDSSRKAINHRPAIKDAVSPRIANVVDNDPTNASGTKPYYERKKVTDWELLGCRTY